MNNTNIENQQLKCINIINNIKERIKIKLENSNNNNNNDGGDALLLEIMFQLKNQYNLFEELIDDQYYKPIRDNIIKLGQYDNELESLKYEKLMIESEINQLDQLKFDINNPSLGISSLSNFLSNQSPEYIEIFNKKPNEKQSIERLEWEIYQRNRKILELENLRKLKIKLNQNDELANNQLKQFQDKLNSNLNVKKSVEPFQKFIGLLPTTTATSTLSTSKNHPLLLESSQPIYILYHELIYFKEFFFNENLIIDLLELSNNNSNNNDGDSIMMNLDDNNNINNTNTNTTKLTTQSKIYISLKINKNDKELSIDFYYYPNLKIVTALPKLNGNDEMGKKLLESLDNSDTGLMTPNLSNHFIFESFGRDNLFKLDDHNLIGRPYKWVQFITGLSFLPEITPENMKDKTFQIHDFQPKTSHQIFFDIINSL